MYVSITVSTLYPLLWLCFFLPRINQWKMGIFKTMKYEYGKNGRWCNALTDMSWGGLQCLIRFSCHHVGWEDVTKPQNRGQAPKEILVFEQDFSKFEESLKDEVWEAWNGREWEVGLVGWSCPLFLSNKIYTLKRRVLCFLICCFNILPKLGCFLEEYFLQRKGLRCFECHPFGANQNNGCTKTFALSSYPSEWQGGRTPSNSKPGRFLLFIDVHRLGPENHGSIWNHC